MTATWTAPRTWTAGELVTAAMLNAHVRDNLEYLAARAASTYSINSNIANITSTSASYVDISSDYAKTVTIATGRARVVFNGAVASSGNNVQLRLLVDGAPWGGGVLMVNTSGTQVIAFEIAISGLSAGNHTFAMQWICIGGVTATLNRASYPVSFNVWEA